MSDYPRPPIEPAPKPFLPDRFLGGIASAIYVGYAVVWFFRLFHRVNALAVVTYYWLYIVVVLAVSALHFWLLAALASGRLYAFIILSVILGVELAATAMTKSYASAAYNFSLSIYCVVRLFGLLGPKPGR